MSYSQQSDTYRDTGTRQRIEMCARQQALIFTADGRPDIKALAEKIVANVWDDIEAVIAAVCVGPNWNQLDDDQSLLAAVQGAWPTVAAARYPAP